MTQAAELLTPCVPLCRSDDRDVDWLTHRQRYIGASECAVLIGAQRWGSLLGLYLRKTDQIPDRDLSDVEPVRWGQILEPVILREYHARSGREAEHHPVMYASTEYPFAAATLDGLTWEASDPDNRWPLEIKNVSDFRSGDWVDGPPAYYVAQLQWQMMVMGATRATICALIGGQNLVWADVARDDIMIRRLAHAGAEFWDRVLRKDPPDPDGSDDAREALTLLHGTESNDQPVELGACFCETRDRLEKLEADISALEKERDTIQNQIRDAMGKHARALLPDGRGWTWTTTHYREKLMPARAVRVLRKTAPKGGK